MRDLSLHLLDIAQNSISARASKMNITVHADKSRDELIIKVADNGNGMGKELLETVTDPFTTTRVTRRVGLGIPLFMASATGSGGSLTIDSAPGKGTTLEATFKISHIDRLPLGNVAETIISVILSKQDIDLVMLLESDTNSFKFDLSDIRERIGEVPVTEIEVLDWIREYIDEGVRITFGGVLNEIVG